MESAEYRTIKLNTSELCLAVKYDLIGVSGALFAADLISKESWEEVRNANHTRESRAANLIKFVLDKVQQTSTNYSHFTRVLGERDPSQYQTVLCMLQDTYDKESSHNESTINQPSMPESSLVQRKSEKGVEMTRSNEDEIRAVFSSLLLEVQSALEAKTKIEEVRHFLLIFFKCTLCETSSFNKLFEDVTLKNLWNYQHHSPVEKLMNKFLHGDQEIKQLMKMYKASLTGFYVVTKLVDYMECKKLSVDGFSDQPSDQTSDQPPPVLTPKQYVRLKVVLQLERKISELSLEYVHKLWCSFAEEYDIPSLTVVLERVTSGSLEITWIIPLHFLDKIVPRSKFFRRHGIVQVSLDDVVLYNREEMADLEKSFLQLFYDSDTALFSYFLERGVDPDIFDADGAHPLAFAAYFGRVDLVELLIQHHADVDLATNDDFGETALIAAVNRHHHKVAEILLNHGANIRLSNKKGQSPLWRAAHYGHGDIVLLLLAHHAGVDLPTDDDIGDTALITAVGQGHHKVVEILLNHCANVNLRNKKGVSPLWCAAYRGHTGIVLLLLEHHAEVDLPTDDERGETPLFAACQEGHTEVATVLLQRGAVVNYVNKSGTTPLHRASFNGHTELVALLLDRGADINKGELTPLYAASDHGHINTVKLLVDRHASVDKRCDSQYGATPLMKACEENRLEIVKYLTQRKADVNRQTKDQGLSPLHLASKAGHSDIVKFLLKSGALLEIKNKEGRTALMIASWRGHLETAIELLKAGADSGTQDQEGLTSLMLATQNGHTDVVCALLGAKTDPNVTENTVGWSALFFAVKSGHLAIVKSLIDAGALVDIKDKNGLTPSEVTDDLDIREELDRHCHSLHQRESVATEEYVSQGKQDNTEIIPAESEGESPDMIETGEGEEAEDREKESEMQDEPKVTEEKKRRDLVKESYRRLLRIFDVLEDSLLPGRREKKLHQQRHSNIEEANREQPIYND